jgi:transposase-like protein
MTAPTTVTGIPMERPTYIRFTSPELTEKESSKICRTIFDLPRKYGLENLYHTKRAGLARQLSNELKQEAVDLYYATKSSVIKKYLCDTLQIHRNVITRWKRGRTEEIAKKIVKRREQRIKASNPKGSKLIGKTLKEILNETRDSNDIIKQTELFSALKDTGFDNSLIVKEVSTLPTEEEFERIMNAVQMLSEQYTIERKVA